MSDFDKEVLRDDGELGQVTLYFDDDKELTCEIIAVFTACGRDYIALLPTEGTESRNGEVYLYRYSEDEDGQPIIDNIESDDEYEVAADGFDEWLDENEYDEIVDEGE